jgi:Cu/Ag efflux pump CusA
MRRIKGIEDLGVFRVMGQPNLNITVDREQAARHQINVADVHLFVADVVCVDRARAGCPSFRGRRV